MTEKKKRQEMPMVPAVYAEIMEIAGRYFYNSMDITGCPPYIQQRKGLYNYKESDPRSERLKWVKALSRDVDRLHKKYGDYQ